MKYLTFPALIEAYLASLDGRASYQNQVRVARQWIRHLRETPTRRQLLARHEQKGRGDFLPGATQANKELSLIRAACRWGLYQEAWQGGDPTAGIHKWKTPRRRRICRFEELRHLLSAFERASTDTEIRDRAILALALFTGCRPSEARTARLGAITPYGPMGCWLKGKTKTGEPHEIPIPKQVMGWLADWVAIRPTARMNPYLFPGQAFQAPLSEAGLRLRWAALRKQVGIVGLWNYDLRRTMASYLGNELHYDDKTIQAVLNHYDGRALSHYYHVSFDALTKVVQDYADWLWALKQEPMRVVPMLTASAR